MRAIDRAVEAAGSQTNLAKSLGISPQAVSAWVEQGRVPLPRLRDVSSITGVAIADLLMDVATIVESSD